MSVSLLEICAQMYYRANSPEVCMRGTIAAGLRPVPIIIAVVVAIFFAAIVSGCGGGGSTTTTTTTTTTPPTPAVSDPEISATLNAFEADNEANLITQVTRANGAVVKNGDIITVSRERPVLHIADAIYGNGVYDPELKDRVDSLNITDVQVDGENLCQVGITYDTVHNVVLDPTNIGEVVYDIDLSAYQQEANDVAIVVSVAGRADPNLAVVLTAKRMGLRPMPSTGQTTITTTTVTKKDNDDSWLMGVVGVVGLVVGLWTGNPGLGVAIACGDPVVTTTFTVVVPASGGVIPLPPPVNHPPTVDLTGPTELLVGESSTWFANAADADGDPLTYRWMVDLFPTGQTLTLVFSLKGTYYITVRVSDGHTVVEDTLTVTVTEPVEEHTPPVAVLDVYPRNGTAPLEGVTLDASGSYATGGSTIVMYAWDTDGDGDYDIDGTWPSVVVDYPVAGTYVPRLKVTDNNGLTDVVDGDTITVNAPPTDIYAGATVMVTPQNAVLDRSAGDEQQYHYRIYAADGLTELPLPDGAFVAWSSDIPGIITADGYLYSVWVTESSTQVYATVHWPDGIRMLTGFTGVYFIN